MSLPVAILCGGLGTRLGLITAKVPKAMIRIDGSPFLDYQLRLLASHGLNRIVLCVGHLGEMIEALVGNGTRYGVDVSYSCDGDTALGTGGAIKKALPLLGDTFGVLYGDTYPCYDLTAIRKRREDDGVMAVRSPGRGNADYRDGRVRAYGHGGSHGDAGYSVLSAASFADYPDCFDLGALFATSARSGRLAGHEVIDPVYEIGSTKGLSEFGEYVLRD